MKGGGKEMKSKRKREREKGKDRVRMNNDSLLSAYCLLGTILTFSQELTRFRRATDRQGETKRERQRESKI